ncbi:Protein kinase-like domain protein [Raphanus sativus]|nr:Protein kinase-like domain protein [Raphanus sativus]
MWSQSLLTSEVTFLALTIKAKKNKSKKPPFPQKKGPPLAWIQRLRIAVDVARGLNYLHFDRAVSHGNLKATNILLDGAELNARVADYCLHRLMTQVGTVEQTLDAGILGCAGDVITGEQEGVVDLTDWVRLRVAEGRGTECFDSVLTQEMGSDTVIEKGIKEVLGIAFRCIRSVSERPGSNGAGVWSSFVKFMLLFLEKHVLDSSGKDCWPRLSTQSWSAPYYSKLLQEYDAIVLSSSLSDKLSSVSSQEEADVRMQLIQIIVASNAQESPHILSSSNTVEEAGPKVVVFTSKDSVLLDLRGDIKDLEVLLRDGFEQKIVVKVLPPMMRVRSRP